MNSYKGMRSAKCATPRDRMQNSRDQVTVYHVNAFVSTDPGWRVFMSCRTKESSSSGSVPCALTIILQLVLCVVSIAAPPELICVPDSVPYLPFPPMLPVPVSSRLVVCQSVYHFLLINVSISGSLSVSHLPPVGSQQSAMRILVVLVARPSR